MVATPLTLHSIQTRAVEVPMARPLGTSAQTMNSAPILLIDMQTEEGIVGHAYLFCYTRMAPGLVATVLADIADALHGERIAPIDFSSRLLQRYRLLGRRDRPHGAGRLRRRLLGRAIPGRWNAAGQLHRIPTAADPSLQQQRPRPDVPEAAADEAEALLDHGFRASSCAWDGRRRRPIWPSCVPSAAACPTVSR